MKKLFFTKLLLLSFCAFTWSQNFTSFVGPENKVKTIATFGLKVLGSDNSGVYLLELTGPPRSKKIDALLNQVRLGNRLVKLDASGNYLYHTDFTEQDEKYVFHSVHFFQNRLFLFCGSYEGNAYNVYAAELDKNTGLPKQPLNKIYSYTNRSDKKQMEMMPVEASQKGQLFHLYFIEKTAAAQTFHYASFDESLNQTDKLTASLPATHKEDVFAGHFILENGNLVVVYGQGTGGDNKKVPPYLKNNAVIVLNRNGEIVKKIPLEFEGFLSRLVVKKIDKDRIYVTSLTADGAEHKETNHFVYSVVNLPAGVVETNGRQKLEAGTYDTKTPALSDAYDIAEIHATPDGGTIVQLMESYLTSGPMDRFYNSRLQRFRLNPIVSKFDASGQLQWTRGIGLKQIETLIHNSLYTFAFQIDYTPTQQYYKSLYSPYSAGMMGFLYKDQYVLLVMDNPKNDKPVPHNQAANTIFGEVANRTKYQLFSIAVNLADGNLKKQSIAFEPEMTPFLLKALLVKKDLIIPSYEPGSLIRKTKYQYSRLTIR